MTQRSENTSTDLAAQAALTDAVVALLADGTVGKPRGSATDRDRLAIRLAAARLQLRATTGPRANKRRLSPVWRRR